MNNSLEKTGKFFHETNEKYKISEKSAEAATAAKVGIMNLWGKAKTLVKKDAPANQNAAAAAENHDDDDAMTKDPQTEH